LQLAETADIRLHRQRFYRLRFGIITADEHQLLQLVTYRNVNKNLLLPPTGGTIRRGRAGRGTGTSGVQGVTTAVATDAPTGVISASAAARAFTCKTARRGLSEEMRELIAELVWLEVSATRAAKFFSYHS
jgi:hypothetical protein